MAQLRISHDTGYDDRPMNERAHDLPLCPEGDFRFWGGVGVIALLALVIGCLAGLPALLPIETISPTAIQRLSAAGASVVWLLLCTGAGAAAFAAIALVRGRPPGSAIDITSRAFACVAVAALTNFVPIDQPMLKLAFDGLAFTAATAFLARSAFRIATLDAFAATAIGTGVVGALAAVAFVITWAVRPG